MQDALAFLSSPDFWHGLLSLLKALFMVLFGMIGTRYADERNIAGVIWCVTAIAFLVYGGKP